LKIVINCIASHKAGTYTVAINLLKALAKKGSGHQFVALAPAGVGYEKIQSHNLEILTFKRKRMYYLWRLWFDQIFVSKLCRDIKADVMLNLTNLPSLFIKTPQILMLQQANLVVRNSYSNFSKERYFFGVQKLMFKLGLKNCTKIIVQTPVVAKKLFANYKVEDVSVSVIKSGFVPVLKKEMDSRSDMSLTVSEETRVLCLCRYYPTKNLEILLEVGKKIKEKGLKIKIFIMINIPGQKSSLIIFLCSISGISSLI